MVLVGVQPSFTQVPPNLCLSMTATFIPAPESRAASAGPAWPVPTTMASKRVVTICASLGRKRGQRNFPAKKQGLSLFFFFGEQAQRLAQGLEVPAHRAAAAADREVGLERGPFGEGEVAVLFQGQELGGALAGGVHLANQVFSRHRRSAMRARYSSTQQWVEVMASCLQISLVSSPACSRSMKTCAVRAGSPARQASSARR